MDRCEECGRPLKSVESMARGVGPVCAQKIGGRISEAKSAIAQIKDSKLRKSKELEIAVAEHVGNKIVMFNKKFGINGEDGEIDVATKTVIIEATIETRGKFTQTTIRFRNPPLNTTRKSVVLYAPKYKLTPKKAVCHKGVRHATNFSELDAALKSIEKWRGIIVDQIILLTNRKVGEEEFEAVMLHTGGKKLEDDRFFFAVGESHLWAENDPHTLAEYDPEEMDGFTGKLGVAPQTCINIQLGHDVNLEEIRPLWAQWIEKFNAALVVDDEIITLDDLYDPSK